MPFHSTRRSRRPRRRRRARRRVRRRSRRVIMPTERKFVDLVGVAATGTAGTAVFLPIIQQGLTENQRIGLQVTLVSVRVAFKLEVGGANPTGFKIALVLYKQQRGLELLLDDYWNSTGTDHAITGPRNIQTALLFRTLWFRKYHLDQSHEIKQVVINKRLRIKSRYATAGGIAANCLTGGLWLVFVSDQAAGNVPTLTFSTRVRFVG